MTVTYSHLAGTFENTDKVIAYNIEQNWTNGNTDSTIPRFENGTDEPDYRAQFDRAFPNAVLVNTIDLDFTENDDEVNSDTVHSVKEEILVTIIAESRKMRVLMENEVNRILWELAPNTATRVVKSDTTNSHIDRFEKSEISFSQIDIPNDQTFHLQGSEGSLFCVYYKFKA